MKKTPFYLFFLVAFSFTTTIFAQLHSTINNVDITHYKFNIAINDTTNIIQGVATISAKVKNVKLLKLDLASKKNNGKGMLVTEVNEGNRKINFKQVNDILQIPITSSDSLHVYTIKYAGIPEDGLIISKNKFGDRTFFGDNWPNRAHYWLPCIDYLYDKATVEFIITAPNRYQVISNGTLLEKTNLNNHYNLYHYATKVPLPTDVMVFGAAKFAVQKLGIVNKVPLSSWVFTQNKEEGFYDYKQAIPILKYYTKMIAPFPYSKLANVQSRTRFGGMENASAIFYSEKSITGKRDQEALLAHEMAHQWFGDSVTEKGWKDLWLSEGFATYFTDLYLEHTYGKEKLDTRLRNQRRKVILYSKNRLAPVVDTKTTDYMKLLNPNSYEKGAWFLHMLRVKLGDKLFWKGIRKYYNTYKYKNVTTKDFKDIIEKILGKNLDYFFKQWLYGLGQPTIKITWKNKSKKVKINIQQLQKSTTIFNFPLQLKINFKNGTSIFKTVHIKQGTQDFELTISNAVSSIILDPNVLLLFKPYNPTQ